MVDVVKVVLKPNKDVAGKTHQALNMSSRQLNKLIRALTGAEPGTVFSGVVGDLKIEITRARPSLPKAEGTQVVSVVAPVPHNSTSYLRSVIGDGKGH